MSDIPRPFSDHSCVLLTKKDYIAAGLPLKSKPVPRSPFKQTFGGSRIKPRQKEPEYAVSVSFRENCDTSNLSAIYDNSSNQTYFEQCFVESNVIGEGSFGVVFRVRSKDDGQLYAVKRSKYPFQNNSDKRTKLEEVRKYESIPNHPNCVQLYRSWIEGNHLYLQMELCDTTLETFAAHNHDIPEEMLWNILTDMLLALKNLHDNNLIHLDIKLENILMCSNGVCKLADFGLVSDVNEMNSETVEGDQKYLAPELLMGQFTKAADIFSLGLVMLELSCDLMLPQNGTLWQELRNDIFPDKYMKDVSNELFAIIRKMMASNYLNRPTVDELLHVGRVQRLVVERRTTTCQVFLISFQHSDDSEAANNLTTPDNVLFKDAAMDAVNSTPNPKGATPSSKFQMNVDMSPIPTVNDMLDSNTHDSSLERFIKRPRNGIDISARLRNPPTNTLLQTPRTNKTRILHPNTMKRKLFQ